MTTNTVVSNLQAAITASKYNPAGLQRAVVGLVSSVSNGALDFVDVSNPAILCLESAAILTAGFMTENQTTTRKQYPYSAQTQEDLYPHMSDKDYVDRFAVPTSTEFIFFFDYDELLGKLVVEDANAGISKVVIPRNSFVTVADTVFSFEYPIEIRQLAHGGLQIVYDVSLTSPFGSLSTNVIEWSIIKSATGQNFIAFSVNLKQFKITSRSFPVTISTGFNVSVGFTDQYYYARVWVDNADGTFTEMATTYTDEIYDPFSLTAVLTVTDGSLAVKIPQVYLTTGLLTKSVRVDVYQTKGPLTMNLVNYRADQFVVSYSALNPIENDVFVAPLNTIRDNYVYSAKQVTGGQNAMTFDELRQRVITNAIGSSSLPITNTQIESALERSGYSVVKNIDNITNRNFLATRPMPDPVASELITAAAAGICTLVAKISDAVAIDTVVDNGTLVTIKPETLYKTVSGQLQLVPSAEIATLKAMTSEQLAQAVNTQSYMYTPFHYVLDSSNNQFNVRPYYLDAPVVSSKSFIAENDTTLLQVSTDSFSISRVATGYVVEILTKSSDEWKALADDVVSVQLSYIPKTDVDRAYVKGVLVSKDTTTHERLYHFSIDITYAIESDNQLVVSSFEMYDQTPRELLLPLSQVFDVLYSTTTPKGDQFVMSTMDPLLGFFDLPDGSYAIAQEQLDIHFGDYLEDLWARTRSVASEADYQRYALDIPATYEDDVYARDSITGASFTIDSDGKLVYTKLHSKGDPVLDDQGNPVLKFRVGDIKLDAYGSPIVTNGRNMLRQMDFFMVEGAYRFATNQVTTDYRQTLTNTVLSWITDDLPSMSSNLLEETEIFYYPTTTVGEVDVLIGANLKTTIDAQQLFKLTLYVKASVYNNVDLRATITRKSIASISSSLNNVTVSISDMIDALRTQYKDDVISLDLKGLGGASNLNVVTLIDGSKRLSLKKQLLARNDETLGLQEGVEVEYLNHRDGK